MTELILPLSVRLTSRCVCPSDADWPASLNSPTYWLALRGRSPGGPRAAVSDSPAAMASYFDEHDCEPLDREQEARTNMLLELARWVRGAERWGQAAGFGARAGWEGGLSGSKILGRRDE